MSDLETVLEIFNRAGIDGDRFDVEVGQKQAGRTALRFQRKDADVYLHFSAAGALTSIDGFAVHSEDVAGVK